MTDKRAFFWIASGGRFLDEAAFSASHVMGLMPDVPRFIFSPSAIPNSSYYTQVVTLTNPRYQYWYMDSTEYMVTALRYFEAHGYRHVVYLDTDTYMISPVPELFDLVEHYDFAGAHAPGRKTCAHIDTSFPSSLVPELNIGVNAMFVPTAIDLFNMALIAYQKHEDLYGDNDQGPLRDTLVRLMINDDEYTRFLVLPPEYNCRFIMPCFLNGDVKILHGRNPDLAKISLDINARTGMRLWQPYQLV